MEQAGFNSRGDFTAKADAPPAVGFSPSLRNIPRSPRRAPWAIGSRTLRAAGTSLADRGAPAEILLTIEEGLGVCNEGNGDSVDQGKTP